MDWTDLADNRVTLHGTTGQFWDDMTVQWGTDGAAGFVSVSSHHYALIDPISNAEAVTIGAGFWPDAASLDRLIATLQEARRGAFGEPGGEPRPVREDQRNEPGWVHAAQRDVRQIIAERNGARAALARMHPGPAARTQASATP